MNRLPKTLVRLAALALPIALALVGCDKPQSQPNAPSQQAALPASFFLTEAPAGAKPLDAIRKDAKDGEEVVVIAKVGGRREPFVENRAAMIVMDPAVKSCADVPGDTCSTPWDYCCEPADQIAAHSATVQVLGADGKPLNAPLKNANGLKGLSEVVVKGIVNRSADGQALVINASGLYVKGAATP